MSRYLSNEASNKGKRMCRNSIVISLTTPSLQRFFPVDLSKIKKLTIVRKGRLSNVNCSVQLIFRTCTFVGKRRGHVYVHKTIVSNLWHYGGGSWDMKLRIGKHPRELHTIKFQLNNTRNIIWTENYIISWQNITSCSLIACHDFLSRKQLLLKEN